MKCSYCRKDIDTNNHVKISTDYFCNNLCKYNFEKDKSSILVDKAVEPQQIIPEDLNFHIEFPNFKFNKLTVQGSHYGYPSLFINDKKIKPYRGRFIARRRKYRVKDDDGTQNEIILKNRLLDAIPLLIINGNKIEIIRSLKWYEYLWIAIPAVLLFIGGAIGAFLGTVGTLTNSLIFRKFNSKIAKYLLTGTNTAIAYFFFFKALFFILPIITEITFSHFQFSQTDVSSLNDKQIDNFKILTSTGWIFKGVYDLDGNDITETGQVIKDSKRYFYKDGDFSQVFYDGSVLNGTWKFTSSFDSLNVITPAENITLKIAALDKDSLVLLLAEVNLIHTPYHFDILNYLEGFL